MSEPNRTTLRKQIVAALLNGMATGNDAAKMMQVAARGRAQRKADAAWLRLVAPYDDWDEADLPELEPPAEQAEVEAIRAEIDGVIAHDRWPRHLHWSV